MQGMLGARSYDKQICTLAEAAQEQPVPDAGRLLKAYGKLSPKSRKYIEDVAAALVESEEKEGLRVAAQGGPSYGLRLVSVAGAAL